MDLPLVIQSLTSLGGVAAAVLAWAAKLQWSKEFKEAKEAQIKAREDHIKSLQNNIDAIQLASEERLKAKDEQIVEELEEALRDKDQLLEVLSTEQSNNVDKIKTLEEEKLSLTNKLSEVKDEIITIEESVPSNKEDSDSPVLINKKLSPQASALLTEMQKLVTLSKIDGGTF